MRACVASAGSARGRFNALGSTGAANPTPSRPATSRTSRSSGGSRASAGVPPWRRWRTSSPPTSRSAGSPAASSSPITTGWSATARRFGGLRRAVSRLVLRNLVRQHVVGEHVARCGQRLDQAAVGHEMREARPLLRVEVTERMAGALLREEGHGPRDLRARELRRQSLTGADDRGGRLGWLARRGLGAALERGDEELYRARVVLDLAGVGHQDQLVV